MTSKSSHSLIKFQLLESLLSEVINLTLCPQPAGQHKDWASLIIQHKMNGPKNTKTKFKSHR